MLHYRRPGNKFWRHYDVIIVKNVGFKIFFFFQD